MHTLLNCPHTPRRILSMAITNSCAAGREMPRTSKQPILYTWQPDWYGSRTAARLARAAAHRAPSSLEPRPPIGRQMPAKARPPVRHGPLPSTTNVTTKHSHFIAIGKCGTLGAYRKDRKEECVP